MNLNGFGVSIMKSVYIGSIKADRIPERVLCPIPTCASRDILAVDN
jgi:hypothetical protein